MGLTEKAVLVSSNFSFLNNGCREIKHRSILVKTNGKMISEVLLYLLIMITCMPTRVSSKKVKWTVFDTSPKLGQDLTLFCEVDNCFTNETKRWYGGPDDKPLMSNSGVSTDKTKYNTSIDKHGFILTILNLIVKDLNVSYECSCGFYLDKHILYIDVYKVKWTVCDTSPKLGQDLTLFCEVNNCFANETKRWYGGPDNKPLMSNSGVSTDKTKYNTSIDKHGFILTILNLAVTDLNVSYECSCGFHLDKHILYIDVYKADDLNKSSNDTNYVGTTDAGVKFGYSAIPVILVIVLIIVIVIKRHWLWRKLIEKINVLRRRNSAEESLEPCTSRDASNEIRPTIVQLAQAGFVHSDRGNFEPSIFLPVHQPTNEDPQRSAEDDIPRQSSSTVRLDSNPRKSTVKIHVDNNPRQSSVKVHVDNNPRQSSDADDGQNVTIPFLQNTGIDSNPRQCSDADDGQNVTIPLLQNTELDSNPRQCSGSSLQSAHVNLNQIQCTDEDDGQNVTDPLIQNAHIGSLFVLNPRQSADLDDNLHGNELLQQPQESINRVTAAAESVEPSTSLEARSEIVEVKPTAVARTGNSITDTERRDSHHLPIKPHISVQYSVNHGDDTASTRPATNSM